MAKNKKNKKISPIASLIAIVLGIIAIAMIFAPSIGIKDRDSTYTGLQIVFGYTEKTVFAEVIHFEFSFMNLLTYLLVAVGVVFVILGAMGKGSKLASFIALVAFAVSAVFFFMQVALSVPNEDLEVIVAGVGNLMGKDISVKDYLTLAVGSIIGAVCSILSALAMAYKVFVK